MCVIHVVVNALTRYAFVHCFPPTTVLIVTGQHQQHQGVSQPGHAGTQAHPHHTGQGFHGQGWYVVGDKRVCVCVFVCVCDDRDPNGMTVWL